MSVIDPQTHNFVVPVKAVNSNEDMDQWQKSEAYEEYVGFINALNIAVKNKSNKATCSMSGVVSTVLELLEKLDLWIDQTPPIDQPQRFGNQAFAQWLKKVTEGAEELLNEALPAKYQNAIPELVVYLVNGFGNGTRIDYGTGHEMSFLMLLCCLFKIGALTQTDKIAAVNKIFARYLTLVRKLQITYRMEPAGSHGVWSLDDYQFVPFIWGSSQLVGQGHIEPKMFLEKECVDNFTEEYMFIGCIEFINKVKTGQFAEHSNQLWNISAVPTWTKINTGLLKMYKAEVLAKFPVIQHVLFGSLLPFKPAQPRPPLHSLHRPPPFAMPAVVLKDDADPEDSKTPTANTPE